jgi:hypothetical protein
MEKILKPEPCTDVQDKDEFDPVGLTFLEKVDLFFTGPICGFRMGGKQVEKYPLSYLSKSEDTFIEHDSRRCESHPVKYYLSKSIWF